MSDRKSRHKFSRSADQPEREMIRVCLLLGLRGSPEGLTADLQVQRLLVLADGVAGDAQVLAGVRELDVLQGERGHPSMAADHKVPVEALQ